MIPRVGTTLLPEFANARAVLPTVGANFAARIRKRPRSVTEVRYEPSLAGPQSRTLSQVVLLLVMDVGVERGGGGGRAEVAAAGEEVGATQ